MEFFRYFSFPNSFLEKIKFESRFEPLDSQERISTSKIDPKLEIRERKELEKISKINAI